MQRSWSFNLGKKKKREKEGKKEKGKKKAGTVKQGEWWATSEEDQGESKSAPALSSPPSDATGGGDVSPRVTRASGVIGSSIGQSSPLRSSSSALHIKIPRPSSPRDR